MPLRLEVIEYYDDTGRSVVHRVPPIGPAEVSYGAQLVVHEGQRAVLVREGQIVGEFGPGRHTLTTVTVPLVARFLSVPWERSPIRAAAYFVGMQPFHGLRWEAKHPIAYHDEELAQVRLRAGGTFAMCVTNVRAFTDGLVIAHGQVSTEGLEDYLRDRIVARLSDVLGKTLASLFDLPARLGAIAELTRTKVAADFRGFGLELIDFDISGITPPDDIQHILEAPGGALKQSDRPSVSGLPTTETIATPSATGTNGKAHEAGPSSYGLESDRMRPDAGGEVLPSGPPVARTSPPLRADASRTCLECGHAAELEANFCSVCGARLTPPRED